MQSLTHPLSSDLRRNVPGKPAQALNFTGGIPLYVKELNECADEGYKGFDLVQ